MDSNNQNQGEFNDIYAKEFGGSYSSPKSSSSVVPNRPISAPPASSDNQQVPQSYSQNQNQNSSSEFVPSEPPKKGRGIGFSCCLIIAAIGIIAAILGVVFYMNQYGNPFGSSSSTTTTESSTSSEEISDGNQDRLSNEQRQILGCQVIPEEVEEVYSDNNITIYQTDLFQLSENQIGLITQTYSLLPEPLQEDSFSTIYAMGIGEISTDFLGIIEDTTFQSCGMLFVTQRTFISELGPRDPIETEMSITREAFAGYFFNSIPDEDIQTLINENTSLDIADTSSGLRDLSEELGWEKTEGVWRRTEESLTYFPNPLQEIAELSMRMLYGNNGGEFNGIIQGVLVNEFEVESINNLRQGRIPILSGYSPITATGYYRVGVYDTYMENFSIVSLSGYHTAESSAYNSTVNAYEQAFAQRGFEVISWNSRVNSNNVNVLDGVVVYQGREVTIRVLNYEDAVGPSGTYVSLLVGSNPGLAED